MHYRTILFDVDGTLLDTREFILQAFEHTLTAAGLPVPGRPHLASLVGPPLESLYAGLAGERRAAELVTAHRNFQADHLHLARPFPLVLETLAVLEAAGLVLGAVTSRSRRTSVRTIELAGLDRFLRTVVSAEDAEGLKPDPRHFDTALERLGAGREGVVVVGDTPADIGGGKAIDAFTVGALYGFHGPALLDSAPDATIDRFDELPAVLGLRD